MYQMYTLYVSYKRPVARLSVSYVSKKPAMIVSVHTPYRRRTSSMQDFRKAAGLIEKRTQHYFVYIDYKINYKCMYDG